MSSLKEKIETLETFLKGYKSFQETGETPHESYVAMRKLFVESNGWFNDVFQFFYGLNKPPGANFPLSSSILPNLNQREINSAVHALRTEGYYVFPRRIADEYLEPLKKFALETPAVLQYDDSKEKEQNKNLGMGYFQLGKVIYDSNQVFDPENLKATNYRFSTDDVLNCPTVQHIMADPVIINIAQQYLNTRILFSLLGMWWTTTFGCDSPSSALAQKYHFDMDRIKFLNFFLYVTDVSEGDGPHCYVKNSCKRKPKELRRDGRFSDEEIIRNYPSKDIVRVVAPRGTLIIGDTRAFHKAEMPQSGNRLVLNFELSTCMFGASYPKANLNIKSTKLSRALLLNPFLWSNFNIDVPKEHQDLIVTG